MIDFGVLILAHMVGDYLWQNDWMASNKTKAHLPCLVHVLFYTLAFFMLVEGTSYLLGNAGWPLWAYALIGLSHYPIDRYSLAPKMMNLNGQKAFKENMAPWSIIIVDNTYHLFFAWLTWVLVFLYT